MFLCERKKTISFFAGREEKNVKKWERMKSVIRMEISSEEKMHNEQFILQVKTFIHLQFFFFFFLGIAALKIC